MNQAQAEELVRRIESQRGLSPQPPQAWRITEVGDLGWVFAAEGVRSNTGYAVTRDGRVATFPLSSVRREDALRRLAQASAAGQGTPDEAPAEALGPVPVLHLGPL